jgi:hypothetical protein
MHSLACSGTADGLTGLATRSGLASKRGTNRYRYAPTDELLRALVFANVTSPIEESAFLRHLHGPLSNRDWPHRSETRSPQLSF